MKMGDKGLPMYEWGTESARAYVQIAVRDQYLKQDK